MTTVEVDGNAFTFPPGWQVIVYDDWVFYRDRLDRPPLNAKACDIVAVDPETSTLYLVEAKDYTHPDAVMPEVHDLAHIVVAKCFDTLGGLAAAAKVVNSLQSICQAAMKCDRVVVSLSIEPPVKANAQLQQMNVLTTLRDMIKRECRFVTSRPIVVSNLLGGAPWTSARL